MTYEPNPDDMSVEKVLPLIEEYRGNISAIARYLGKNRTQVKDYIDRKPELLTALNDFRQGIVDKAEDNLFLEVEKGDSATSKMVVATLGKDRGWVPREEKTGKDGNDLIPPSILIRRYGPEDDVPKEEE